ncbi:MAG: PadR family transcriptional regulator [Geodermatophilaceae bacterium]
MSTYASAGWRDASTAWNSLVAAAAEAVRGAAVQPGRGDRSRNAPGGRGHRGHDHEGDGGHGHGQRHGRRHDGAEQGRFDRADGGPGFPFGPGGMFGPGGPGGHHEHGGHPGHAGPGFGPPGPWRARGRGRGRGARRRGDVRAAILVLLDEQPRHGYELISEISERSSGIWRPSPGTVYPTLSQLEDEGLITLDRLDGRKTATLTDQGRAYIEENRAQLGEPWTDVAGDVRAENRTLAGVIAQVGMAASTVALHGTPEQATQAAEILEQARQQLYGLMAQPKVAEQPSAPESSGEPPAPTP